jgi:exodeoxyribonuclease V beta subunit
MSQTTPDRFDPLTVPLSPGITLVEASAGTGKTFAITRLVLRLLLEGDRPLALREIAVVTFTEKGTNELITRLRAVLRLARDLCSDAPPPPDEIPQDLVDFLRPQRTEAGARIAAALASIDQLSVSTIHGFCRRILTEFALEAGVHFDLEFVENDTANLTRAAHDWARRTLVTDIAPATVVAADGVDPAVWAPKLIPKASAHPMIDLRAGTDLGSELLHGFVTAVQTGARRERERRHAVSFDDLLQRLSAILTTEGPDGTLARRIRERFRAAVIDEFQDTDPFQFPIFQTAFTGCPLFLIGDPKQSIYAFRGADVRAYLTAARSATQRFTLDVNYRSTPELVAAVQSLFHNHPSHPFGEGLGITLPEIRSAGVARRPAALQGDDRQALHWLIIRDDRPLKPLKKGVAKAKPLSKALALRAAIDATVRELLRLRARGMASQGMAILVRDNQQARQMKDALDRVGVPAVVTSNQDVLRSDEGEELTRLALAIAEPGNERLIRAALATRCWGATADDIARMLHGDSHRAWGDVISIFRDAHEAWVADGITTALSRLLDQAGTIPRLLTLPDGERRVTNLRHLLELLREEQAATPFPPAAFRAWVARERQLTSVPERREQRLESDAEAVQIMTIHKAKGLQWSVVFLPTLWYVPEHPEKFLTQPVAIATLPDPADPARTIRRIDLNSESLAETQAAAKADEAAEAMRLAYVALTRAETRCYVVWGPISNADASAVAALLREEGGIAQVERLVDAHPMVMSRSDDRFSLGRPSPSVHGGETAGIDQPVREPLDRPARRFTPAPGRFTGWRTSSYSALTSGRHDLALPDRDVEDPPLPVAGVISTPASTGIFAIKKGPEIGDALHHLLEHLDFPSVRSTTGLEAALPAARIEEALARFGVPWRDDDRWSVADIQRVLRDACLTRLPGADFALAAIPTEATLREWKFTIPVGRFDLQTVASALERHGSPLTQRYAEKVRRMRTETFSGYLTGVVDLAFEQAGRWWIVDWKSNHLGDTRADYDEARMGEAMVASDYLLQYHLYLVALHRHLRARIPGYASSTHWGGVAYVFLRGMADGEATGWFRDTPSPALIAALDAALAGGDP